MALAVAGGSRASETTDEYCPEFHDECVEARAQGYRDVGICNVERLECPTPPAGARGVVRTPKRGPAADPEASHGERAVGP